MQLNVTTKQLIKGKFLQTGYMLDFDYIGQGRQSKENYYNYNVSFGNLLKV